MAAESTVAPWRPRDLYAWFGGLVLSAALLGVAWFGASGSVRTPTQYRWVNLAASAVILSGAANVLWILAGRRSVGLYRNMLLTGARERLDTPRWSSTKPFDADLVVVAASARFYHRATCQLVQGKPTRMLEPPDLEALREPCGMCQP